MPRLLLIFCLLLLAACDRRSGYDADLAEEHRHDAPVPSGAVGVEPAAGVRTAEPAYYGAVRGYYAAPARPDSLARALGRAPGDTLLPGLIVIHEWWGLNDNIRAAARRLAGEGYRVLAVDLYNGAPAAATPEEARALVGASMQDMPALRENLRAAYRYLAAPAAEVRVGVLGWCYGGRMAQEAAFALPDRLGAAVIYYGAPVLARERLAALRIPILGHFGADDGSIPLDSVRLFEQTLRGLDRSVEIHVYDSAGHAFANPSGRNYQPEAAEAAWERTLAFLRRTLQAAP